MDNDPQAASDFHNQFDKVWGNPRGWRAFTIVNHTTIGLRFLITGGVFFLIGGLLAMLIRTQLALPGHDLLTPEIYNQVFTMHGTIMMFLFAVPVMEGFAIYLIPKMIGARDLVFPRLSAFGYWCYLFGGIILTSSLIMEIAPASGWFMYTPLSSAVYAPGPGSDFWLLGITFVEISAVSAGVELVVSIMRTRTKGMSLQRMPLFAWYILAMALMIVFGFPPLILGSILLELERAAGMPFFDVARGGDPILWQHLFWLFGHPEVYILFLPAAGMVSTILPVFAQRPIAGYRWVVLSIITTGFISFGLWVHHMFTVGIPQLAQAFFSAASMMVAIPTAIQVFVWLATLWNGRPVYAPPMLWILGFLIIFVAGGLTGVMLALVPFDWQVHDTHFVVAHFHYVLVGGMFFPLMAGIYYWLPHFSGRMPNRQLARWGFWLVFIGFNLTFLVMHFTGLLGMPRRIYTYDANLGWDIPNMISSVGSFIMATGIATCLLDIALHFRFGEKAKANPWNADTLEWSTSLPPSAYNFATLPEVTSRHPLWENPDLQRTIEQGHHDLATIDHGRRETWGSDPLTAKTREIIHLPGNSWLPFFAALTTAALCMSLLTKHYMVAIVAALCSVALLLRWSWENGAHPQAAPNQRRVENDPPLHSRTHDGPGLWGMAVTLLTNGSLYLSLLFGWLYLWTVAPNWQLPTKPPVDGLALLLSGVCLSVALWWFKVVIKRLRNKVTAHLQPHLWGISGLGFIHLATLIVTWQTAALKPQVTSHDAVITVMLVYQVLHSGLAVIITALQALRVGKGYVGHKAPYEPVVVERWWVYTAAVFWISYAAIIVLPMMWVVP
ncbi:cytochrome c oxidase subunit I [Gilvimarinus sp. 1_MG-2023]|uniref:cytochrome c oxidase subunit I n=1 Tax=Gilvimarinus sp. 1_MG-2023 TaxID=3062638 RepID=UPI0026E225F9|nr:cytochrome c oxidase subunit I [Gilvimarinus sp. 1_MG-2023]MDO6746450.1 cytochrome c oxidase subunit I [Gilvimarinus sp. 1_MG-2023]